MNIYAKRGTKIVFAHPNAGYVPDQERAKKYLELGKTYTVERTEVHSWSTDIHLMEVPGQRFNSVMFDEKEDRHSGQNSQLAEAYGTPGELYEKDNNNSNKV